MIFITAEDLQRSLSSWSPTWGETLFSKELAEHVATRLSAIALARVDKRLAAGEALVEAAKLIMGNRDYVDGSVADPCIQCEMVEDEDDKLVHELDCPWEATKSALAAYEKASIFPDDASWKQFVDDMAKEK